MVSIVMPPTGRLIQKHLTRVSLGGLGRQGGEGGVPAPGEFVGEDTAEDGTDDGSDAEHAGHACYEESAFS